MQGSQVKAFCVAFSNVITVNLSSCLSTEVCWIILSQ